LQKAARASIDSPAAGKAPAQNSIYNRFNTSSGAATAPAQAMPYSQAAQTAGASTASAAQAAGTAAAQDLGAMSKLYSGLKGVASKAAFPLTAAYSIYEGYQQIAAIPKDTPRDQYRVAVAKIVARLVNEFGLFWVGAILGAGLAGAISGPGAIVGFIAGGAGGIAANYFLGDSAGAITDSIVDQLYGTSSNGNSSKINISPEDAAVLDQALKDIQTLSRDPAVAADITPDIRAQIDRVVKGAAKAIAADTPAASTQSAPAASAAASAAPDELVKSVEGIEKILTKYRFEDIEADSNINIMTENELRSFILKRIHLLSETDQMAVRRDLMIEGPLLSTAKKVWNGAKWLTDKSYQATKFAMYGGLAMASWELAPLIRDFVKNYRALSSGPTKDEIGKLSEADLAELEQHALVLEKYLKTPEDAAKLPQELQQRLADINTRMKKAVAAGVVQ